MSKKAGLTKDQLEIMRNLIIENDQKAAYDEQNNSSRKMAKNLLPDIIKKLDRPIALSTLQREMAKTHVNDSKNEIDKPWSIAALSAWPIPPENVPTTVMYCQQFNDMARDYGLSERFTIRQALWCNRLSGYLAKYTRGRLPKGKGKQDYIKDMQELLVVAVRFAARERSVEIYGGEFDTTHFDAITIHEMKVNTDPYFSSVIAKQQKKEGKENG